MIRIVIRRRERSTKEAMTWLNGETRPTDASGGEPVLAARLRAAI